MALSRVLKVVIAHDLGEPDVGDKTTVAFMGFGLPNPEHEMALDSVTGIYGLQTRERPSSPGILESRSRKEEES